MALLVIRHEVGDYGAWREIYDSMGDAQRHGGVTKHSVHQLDGAPNTVLVLHEFDSVAAAQTFLGNPEILAAMHESGVTGEPRVEIYS